LKLELSFCVLVFLTGAATAQESVHVSVPVLNVHAGPGTDYSILGQAHQGEGYVAIATSGSWRRIWFGPGIGWVHGSYLDPSNLAKRKVTAAALNVRTGPGTGYDVVATIPQGSWWAVAAASGSWRKIFFKGATRWVHGAYLSSGSGGALPTSSVGFVQLPASGPGFTTHVSAYRRWGKPSLVYGFMSAAAGWNNQHDWPRMSVGDISYKYGGTMGGHVSHKVGKDVDIWPIRKNGEGATKVGWSSYSRPRTKDLITHHLKLHLNVKLIFFNDSILYNALSYVQYWPNHYNHLHLRIW